MTTNLLILFGPTASGKTRLATLLAQTLPVEIISADSMAIYRQMNIGTAKPTLEERQQIPYHLIDICDPWESYNAGIFVESAAKLIQEITTRHKIPLIVGGTALYVKSLLEGIFEGPPANWELRNELAKDTPELLYQKLMQIDATTAQHISCHDVRRIIRALEVFYTTGQPISICREQNTHPLSSYSPCFIGIEWDRQVLYRRIEERVDSMLEQGLIEETRCLLALPHPLSHTASQAIGYKETIAAIANPSLMDNLSEQIKQNTRRFAKRQLTWLKKFPIQWIPAHLDTSLQTIGEQALQLWNQFLRKESSGSDG